MPKARRRLRVLTWHVHGNYLYNLTQVPHDFYLATDAARSMHHSGRSGTLPWGPNVHEAPVEALRDMAFDVVLFQSRHEWDDTQHRLLSTNRRPCQSPTKVWPKRRRRRSRDEATTLFGLFCPHPLLDSTRYSDD